MKRKIPKAVLAQLAEGRKQRAKWRKQEALIKLLSETYQ